MIDPKLNELPGGRSAGVATAPETDLPEAERAERLKKSRTGLSINDTIAGDN